MNGLLAFTKKEFREHIYNYKALILLAVFFVFGMISPLLAKLMPEIFSHMSIEGLTVTITEPTYIEAYSQFFKNITQMGIIVILLVFSGILSRELARGTLIIILAKGLSRHAVILAKYFVALTLWTISYSLAAIINFGYTFYLFGQFYAPNLLFSLFCLWLFGAFILAVVMMSSTLTSGNYGGLLLTAAILGILLTINIFPTIKNFNPVSLASNNIALITNIKSVSELLTTIWITLALSILCLLISWIVFRRKKL